VKHNDTSWNKWTTLNIVRNSNLLRYTDSHLFDVHVTVHHDRFLTIKPTSCSDFSNIFL